jgi:hypothetical protein
MMKLFVAIFVTMLGRHRPEQYYFSGALSSRTILPGPTVSGPGDIVVRFDDSGGTVASYATHSISSSVAAFGSVELRLGGETAQSGEVVVSFTDASGQSPAHSITQVVAEDEDVDEHETFQKALKYALAGNSYVVFSSSQGAAPSARCARSSSSSTMADSRRRQGARQQRQWRAHRRPLYRDRL